MGKLKILFTGLIAVSAFSGCGGGGSGGGLTGDGSQGAGQTTADYTIAVSYPNTDAITKLDDEAGGVYSMSGSVVVTDRNGNPAPEGTIVHLDVTDTIKARGTIAGGDSLSSTTLTDTNPLLANIGVPTATTFDVAGVTRNGAFRGIGGGDLVLLTSASDAEDKNRSVSTAANSFTANTITVSSTYTKAYPNATYASGTTNYVVASSELGAKVHGIHYKTSAKLGAYTNVDETGVGKFRIEYPANANTINVGCFASGVDTRYEADSAVTYVIARLGNGEVTVVDTQFCFFSIADSVLTASPENVGVSGTSVTLSLLDAERVSLPFRAVTASVVATAGTVTASGCTTVVGGICTSTITCTSPGAATVTYSSGVASADVTVACP